MYENSKIGRKATEYMGRYTPVLSSHPLTRLAYRRAFIDHLQMIADPDAEKSFKAKRARHGYFIEPGPGIAPQRAPTFGAALGETN
ncbi:MAG: hypothetical protein U5K75_00185 [Ahrensia sp.]|nr:hypothetical protein [Ahrensia sp.]